MTATPYLLFNGNCAEAMKAYADIFDGEIKQLLHADDMPPDIPIPANRRGWVMHATIDTGDGLIMASDDVSGDGTTKMAGCSVMLNFPTAAAGKLIFDKLADGGQVNMPWAATFWTAGFGTCVDRFGIRWMVGCDEAAAGQS